MTFVCVKPPTKTGGDVMKAHPRAIFHLHQVYLAWYVRGEIQLVSKSGCRWISLKSEACHSVGRLGCLSQQFRGGHTYIYTPQQTRERKPREEMLQDRATNVVLLSFPMGTPLASNIPFKRLVSAAITSTAAAAYM